MKKILIILIVLLFPIIVLSLLNGDVNGDGKISVSDYNLVRGHILGISKLTEDNLKRADTNNDGKISTIDYINIKKIILGIDNSPTKVNVTYIGSNIIKTGYEGKEIIIEGKKTSEQRSLELHLSKNTDYVVSFDYKTVSGSNKFDVDLYPDTLPQIYPIATKTSKHYEWHLSSKNSDMSKCYLRIFDDMYDKPRDESDEKDIIITNVLMSKVEKLTYNKGESASLPKVKERVGFKFLGWYTKATGGTKINDINQITEDTTLYAHWEYLYANSYGRIHFLKQPLYYSNDETLGAGDAIILESKGYHAMIDTGLNNAIDNKFILDYLKNNGVISLDFILITHIHRDHIGGLEYLLNNIPVSRIYIKKNPVKGDEVSNNIYNKAISLANKKGIKITYVDTSFKDGQGFDFHGMNIKLYNTAQGKAGGPNGDSILEYININGYKVFLTGDLNNNDYSIKLLKNLSSRSEFKNLDLLKMPHHGYTENVFTGTKKGTYNVAEYKRLNPKYVAITRARCDICNELGATKNVYYAGKYNGVVFDFGKTVTVNYIK